MWLLPSTSPLTSQCISDPLLDIMRFRTCKQFVFIFQIQTLEAADFADVRPLFAPLMHTVKKEETIGVF